MRHKVLAVSTGRRGEKGSKILAGPDWPPPKFGLANPNCHDCLTLSEEFPPPFPLPFPLPRR